jgi:hypothetical protein
VSPSPAVRRILLVLAAAVLLTLAWNGLSGGVHQVSQSLTPGQKAQTACQFAYGALALLSLVTAFVGRRWHRAIVSGWVVSVTLAAGLASIVWGGTALATGVLAGAVTLLVAATIGWMLRVGARSLPGTA